MRRGHIYQGGYRIAPDRAALFVDTVQYKFFQITLDAFHAMQMCKWLRLDRNQGEKFRVTRH